MKLLFLYIFLYTATACVVQQWRVERYLNVKIAQLVYVRKSNLIRYRTTDSLVMRTVGLISEFCDPPPTTTTTTTTTTTSPTTTTTTPHPSQLSSTPSTATTAATTISSLTFAVGCLVALLKCYRYIKRYIFIEVFFFANFFKNIK